MRLLLARKLIRDIGARGGQFAFMALAVFLAVFALGTMLGSYATLRREVRANYLSTRPAEATLVLDRVDAGLRRALATPGFDPEIASWEARGSALGRIRNPAGGWSPLLVFLVDDYSRMRVGRAFRQEGSWPPGPGSILVERSAMGLIGAKIGDEATIVFPGTAERAARISGTTHDPGLAPAWQERTVYAYSDAATLSGIVGSPFALDQLKVVFRDEPPRRDVIRQRAEALAGSLAKLGYEVGEIQIPPPEAHPHQSQMNTILLIFLLFACLSLLLSSILLASVLKALMGGEVRLLGIMKSLGGGARPLAAHYLLMALAPALAGSLCALPLGALASRGLSSLVGGLLNLDMGSTAAPAWVLASSLAAGLILPLLLAALPVAQAIGMSVREALSPRDLAAPTGSPSRPASRPRMTLPPLFAMALRNLGRRPARLALSLGLLGIAGGLFMTAMNMQTSWGRTLERSLSLRRFDLELRLMKPIDAEAGLAALRAVPGVAGAESRALIPAYAIADPSADLLAGAAAPSPYPVSSVYPDKGHGSFSLRSLSAGAKLIALPLIEGSSLEGGPREAAATSGGLPPLLLNQNARALFASASVGKPIELSIGGSRRRFALAGVVREFAPAAAYLREGDMAPLMGGSNAFLIAYAPASARPAGSGAGIGRACEEALRKVGATISLGLPEEEFSTALGEHTQILIFALLMMAVLMGLVGLLGLSASLGATVLERTRETGVLRSIGAGRREISALIVLEAELTAALSLGIALALSFPLSYALGRILGQLSFRLPLDFVVSLPGLAIWMAACLIGAGLSCAGAVRSTLALPLPRALAWE
jgi:putative ABC transport system permease protein